MTGGWPWVSLYREGGLRSEVNECHDFNKGYFSVMAQEMTDGHSETHFVMVLFYPIHEIARCTLTLRPDR